jgi:D-glycero-alpha-D-manno-heptose-7-phosphate kinase
MIIAKTPFRISLFGGGTDLPTWLEHSPGKIFSFAINKYCYITLRELNEFFDYKYAISYYKKEHVSKIKNIKHQVIQSALKIYDQKTRFEIEHKSDLPARSGIGSSSSFTVGLLNNLFAWKNKFLSKKKLADLSINLEQNILKESVGIQDQIRAAYGGIGFINISKKKYEVKNISTLNNINIDLEKNSFLVYTGISRNASKVEQKKQQALKNRNSAIKNMREIYQISCEAEKIIKSKNYKIKDLGKLLSAQWEFKKKLASGVSNSNIDDIYDFVTSCGAYGGKLLGAGSGGFFVFFGSDRVINKIKSRSSKLKVLKNVIDYKGSVIFKTKL